MSTIRSLRRKTNSDEGTRVSTRPPKETSGTNESTKPVRRARVARETSDISLPKSENNSEIAELKALVQKLSANQKGTRKLSALNKLKKYVLSKSTEKALIETDFADLIPVDKMRLLNKAYPIVWNQLVLEPLYKKYNCNSLEEQEHLKSRKNIQLEYHIIVDDIIEQSKEGELDDQEHFRDDITTILISAIQQAAKEFGMDNNDVADDEEIGAEIEAEE